MVVDTTVNAQNGTVDSCKKESPFVGLCALLNTSGEMEPHILSKTLIHSQFITFKPSNARNSFWSSTDLLHVGHMKRQLFDPSRYWFEKIMIIQY